MRAPWRIGSVAALVLVAGAGCATFIRGNTTTVTVRSDAPGAEVVVDGEPRGVTPMAMALDHTVDHDVVVRLGAAERSFRLVSSIEAGWVVLNFFATGIIGIAVDAVTGAWRGLSQESVYAAFGAASLLAPQLIAPTFVAPTFVDPTHGAPTHGAPAASTPVPVAPWTEPR